MTASVDWIETFKRTFLRDDLDGFMELIAPDCDWTIMATGEKFTGAPRIRELAQRSIAARRHVGETGIEPVNLLSTDACLVFEYIHNAVVTDNWPASTNRPAPGTTLRIPICIVAHTNDGKFDWLREYFDLATASGRQGQKLYS